MTVAEEHLAIEKAAREKEEREDAEKIAREKAEREAAEKAARGKLGREAVEKAKREKTERDAAEKATREKAKREATEKAKREKTERRVAQIAVLKGSLSKSFNAFMSALPKAMPFLRIGGIIGIILALFWVSSWAMPQILSLVPTAQASVTPRPTATIASSKSPVPFAKTVEPNATPTKTRTPAPTDLPTEITDAKGVQMVLVPAGQFMMGSDSGGADERPAHKVYLDAYYIDKYEVTSALYKACVDIGDCTELYDPIGINRFDNRPVVYVNWDQAKAYCEWRGARLPTEAEWEKAARGTDGRTYPWGEGIDCSFANYGKCKGHLVLTAIGAYEKGKSPYGIYDMAGNVYEWVADWYAGNYYATLGENAINPQGPSSGQYRVLRGGGDHSGENSLRSTFRQPGGLNKGDFQIGFRRARDANP